MLNTIKTDLAFNWALTYNKSMVYKIYLFESPFQAYAKEKSLSKKDFKEFLKDYHRNTILPNQELSDRYVSYLVALRLFQ